MKRNSDGAYLSRSDKSTAPERVEYSFCQKSE